MRLWIFALALCTALTAPEVRAAELLAAIPLAPHGDASAYATGHVIPLTPGAFLVPLLGPDGVERTADDVTVLVQDPGGPGQTVTPLATPFTWEYSRNTRVSSTRAVLQGAGPDGTRRTADDVLLLLDGLGSTNTVTPITVGPIEQEDASIPIALSPGIVVQATLGPDASSQNADDTVALVTDLGGANTVTQLPAPFLETGCCIRSVRLGPESFLLASAGPDGSFSTADDVVYFFHDLATAPARTDLAAPFLYYNAEPAALSSTRAVVQGVGPDGSGGTADDQLLLLNDLGGANIVTPVSVPFIVNTGGGKPVAAGPDRALVSTYGADGTSFTADDSIVVATNLGGANVVTEVVVGYLSDYASSRATLLSEGVAAVVSFGPDASADTADDQLAVISDLGGTNTTLYLGGVGGLSDGSTSIAARLGPGTVAVASGGPDGVRATGSGDDDHVVLSGIGAALLAEAIPAGGDFGSSNSYPHVMQSLGGGRAAYVGSGADNLLGQGGDDQARVIQDLDADPALEVQKLKIAVSSKGEKLKVTAAFPEDLADRVGNEDLTVQVGTVTQVIPASAFTAKKSSVSYKDKTQVVSSVKLSLKKGTLTVKGQGTATGLEDTDPGYVPVSVLIGGDYRAASVAGTATGNGVKFKAPK